MHSSSNEIVLNDNNDLIKTNTHKSFCLRFGKFVRDDDNFNISLRNNHVYNDINAFSESDLGTIIAFDKVDSEENLFENCIT